jgi:protein-L-isoaspartate O-methyltransferase
MSKPPKLAGIQEALTALHEKLDQPYRATEAGMWACSELDEVCELFDRISLAGFQHLADLGSGDGRVVMAASLFTRATGIESDPALHRASQDLAKSLGLNRAAFILGDCRAADLGPYDLLYIYPDKPLAWLGHMLPASWPGRLLVYGPYFKPEHMRLRKNLRAGRTACSLWSR